MAQKTKIDSFEEFYKFYRSGEYLNAVHSLEKITGGRELEGKKSYLTGLCYKNLQDFANAQIFFKKSIQIGNKSEDLFYEYGQVLYAINDLDKAYKAFQISFKKGFRPAHSLYYMAHVSEILENPQGIKKNYLKIIKDKESELYLRQVAYLRLGEVIYGRTKGKANAENYVIKYIIPLWDKGIKLDAKSKTASEIEERKDQVLLEYNRHPLMMINGKRLSKKSKTLSIEQTIAYDDNVTLVSEGSSSSNATFFPSYIYTTDLFGSFRMVLARRFIMTPEFKYSYLYYSDQETRDVSQNDSYVAAPAIRTNWEDSFGSKQATFIFDFEYNYTARERLEADQKIFFSRFGTFILGEKIRFTKRGETTFKIKKKSFTSFDSASNSDTTTFSVDQVWVTNKKNIFIGLFQYDGTTVETATSSTDSFLFRIDFLSPNAFWGMTFSANTSLTFLSYTDASESELRGVEKLFTAGLKVIKRWNKNWILTLAYDYNKNMSELETSEYSKNISTLKLKYSFY
jgi:tetratricopeptide (TPR) repeat protein